MLAEYGHEVVGALGEAENVIDAADRHQPDLVILDVRMPPTHTDEGLRAAIAVRAIRPGTAVLVLSQHVEERYASASARCSA